MPPLPSGREKVVAAEPRAHDAMIQSCSCVPSPLGGWAGGFSGLFPELRPSASGHRGHRPRRRTATVAVYWAAAGRPRGRPGSSRGLRRAAKSLGARFVDATPVRALRGGPVAGPRARSRQGRLREASSSGRHRAPRCAASAAVERSGGGDLDSRQLSEIFFYRGLAKLEATSEAEEAWDDLVNAARLDPTRVLDPARFPPRAVSTFNRAVTEVTASSARRADAGGTRRCGGPRRRCAVAADHGRRPGIALRFDLGRGVRAMGRHGLRAEQPDTVFRRPFAPIRHPRATSCSRWRDRARPGGCCSGRSSGARPVGSSPFATSRCPTGGSSASRSPSATFQPARPCRRSSAGSARRRRARTRWVPLGDRGRRRPGDRRRRSLSPSRATTPSPNVSGNLGSWR